MVESKIRWIEKFQTSLSDRQALDLLLVITGSRPACLIMDPNQDAQRDLQKFCQKEDYFYKIYTDNNSSSLGDQGFFITSDMERLSMLENSTGRFYGLDDRDVGRFLGFPKEDSEYFHENIKTSPVEPEMREKINELRKDNKISQKEAELIELVSYIPKPADENIYSAIERGKKHFESINNFDKSNNTNIGKNILEDFYGTVFESFRNNLLD